MGGGGGGVEVVGDQYLTAASLNGLEVVFTIFGCRTPNWKLDNL